MKKLLAMILAAGLLLCTGCGTTAVEVRERIYIHGASLSSSNTLTKLTLYPYEPAGTQINSTGMTLTGAVEEAAILSGRSVFMGHLELLCLEDAISSSKLRSCMDEYRLSPACRVMYLTDPALLEGCDTIKLTDQLHQEEENGRIPETDLFHILSELAGSDGSALIPVLSEEGFGIGLIRDSEFLGTVSDHAVQGLCWLRGENYPKRISVIGSDSTEDYEIHSARTELSAEIQDGIPHITVTIRIRGSGNHEAVKRLIAANCVMAEKETIKEMKADVMGLGACLQQDCPDYYKQYDFETAKWAAVFEHVIIAEE